MEISSSLSEKWQRSQRRYCRNSSNIGNVTFKNLFATELNYLFSSLAVLFHLFPLQLYSTSLFLLAGLADVPLEPTLVVLYEWDYMLLSDATSFSLPGLVFCLLQSSRWVGWHLFSLVQLPSATHSLESEWEAASCTPSMGKHKPS